jgi:hypothetical protein
MNRGRLVRALAGEAGDGAAREPFEQTPLPTLDERATLYLRAVYGNRDFTNEEYSHARNLMLTAMAADIGARSDARSPSGASLPIEVPTGVDFDEHPVTDRAVEDIQTDRAVEDTQEAEAPLARPPRPQAFPDLRLPPVWLPPVFSGGPLTKRAAAGWAVAACAVVAVLWLAGIFATTWFGAASHDSRVAVEASPPERSGGTRPDADVRVAEAQREVASAFNAAQLGPDEIAALVKHGQDLIADGKFLLARLVLGQAAEAGSAPAALAIGRTYDPTLPERSVVRADAAPDIAKARAWYERAKNLGSAEAGRRLSQLSAPAPAPPVRPGPK